MQVNGRPVINFGSANYLGLEQDPDVLKASADALTKWGTHAGCSRVFSSHENIIQLEQELSVMMGSAATLIGHNISQIHAGVLPALFSSGDSVLLIDKHAHTSMYQASLIAKAKGARLVRVDISDLRSLQKIIEKENPISGALLVDGVYSMQGHLPPLGHLDQICRDARLVLYVDDAHGVGIYGHKGGGVVEELSLNYDNLLVIGSLQKAFGTYGGFISGHQGIIDFLRVSSKSYIFSGTLQPAAVEGARAAIRVSQSAEGTARRARLKITSAHLRRELQKRGFKVPSGDSPIVPVTIGDDMQTLMAGRKMYDAGIYLNSVLFPAVPRDQGILRISLTSLHSDQEITQLVQAFTELKKYLELFKNPVRRWSHFLIEMSKSKIQGSHYEGL